MNKMVLSKLAVCLFILLIPRVFFSQSLSDSVDWTKQQKNGCVDIKEKLTIIDSSASANTLVESCRCALLLKNGLLALEYLNLAEKKGFSQPLITDILKVRTFSLLKEDEKAVDFLRTMSQKIDLFFIMKMPEIQELSRRNADAMELYQTSLPSFDVFTFIISVVCFLGFFAGILFFIKGNHSTQLRWLALFVINFSTIMSSFVLYWTKYTWVFPYLNEWWHPLYLLTGPFFYFYLRNITGQKNSIESVFLHIFPFILCVAVFGANGLFFQSAALPYGPNILITIFQSMPVKLASLIIYFLLSLSVVNGDWMTDSYVRNWIQSLFIFFGVFILANAVYYGCTFWTGFNREWDYGISAVMAFGITGVAAMGFLESGYLSFRHTHTNETRMPDLQHEPKEENILQTSEDEFPKEKKYKSSTITSAVSGSVKVKLEKLMSENRLYQRENLRLQDVAGIIGLHRNQVSQIINENFNLSFFEWVNKYRIYHAADMLSVPDCPFTISQVGYESGFNNKVTFYKTFRQYFNCTPLEYASRVAVRRATMN